MIFIEIWFTIRLGPGLTCSRQYVIDKRERRNVLPACEQCSERMAGYA
jgi:hypothetical protein